VSPRRYGRPTPAVSSTFNPVFHLQHFGDAENPAKTSIEWMDFSVAFFKSLFQPTPAEPALGPESTSSKLADFQACRPLHRPQLSNPTAQGTKKTVIPSCRPRLLQTIAAPKRRSLLRSSFEPIAPVSKRPPDGGGDFWRISAAPRANDPVYHPV